MSLMCVSLVGGNSMWACQSLSGKEELLLILAG